MTPLWRASASLLGVAPCRSGRCSLRRCRFPPGFIFICLCSAAPPNLATSEPPETRRCPALPQEFTFTLTGATGNRLNGFCLVSWSTTNRPQVVASSVPVETCTKPLHLLHLPLTEPTATTAEALAATPRIRSSFQASESHNRPLCCCQVFCLLSSHCYFSLFFQVHPAAQPSCLSATPAQLSLHPPPAPDSDVFLCGFRMGARSCGLLRSSWVQSPTEHPPSFPPRHPSRST